MDPNLSPTPPRATPRTPVTPHLGPMPPGKPYGPPKTPARLHSALTSTSPAASAVSAKSPTQPPGGTSSARGLHRTCGARLWRPGRGPLQVLAQVSAEAWPPSLPWPVCGRLLDRRGPRVSAQREQHLTEDRPGSAAAPSGPASRHPGAAGTHSRAGAQQVRSLNVPRSPRRQEQEQPSHPRLQDNVACVAGTWARRGAWLG